MFLNLKFDFSARQKSQLDKYSHPAKIRSVYPPYCKTIGIDPSGGFGEKCSPEVVKSKRFQ
jgi:hypothetical protein